MTQSKNKFCILVYTHTKSSMCWNPFFSRLKKYASNFDCFVLCNDDSISKYVGRENLHVYNESDSFTKQLTEGITKLISNKFQYFIYSQEDFILYSEVSDSAINDAIQEIENGYTEFVKLIKSGGREFCLQASLHKTDSFTKFISENEVKVIWEEPILSKASIGRYESRYLPDEWVGFQRGMYHFDSKVWPYIATALNKGKWNTHEYPYEMQEIFDEFNNGKEIIWS